MDNNYYNYNTIEEEYYCISDFKDDSLGTYKKGEKYIFTKMESILFDFYFKRLKKKDKNKDSDISVAIFKNHFLTLHEYRKYKIETLFDKIQKDEQDKKMD